MINTKQLLQLVVDRPKLSACDLRFLTQIWEAFLQWCKEQFDAKVGIHVLGMGQFCLRRDVIGEMEFLNPMFIMAESYRDTYGLHDRRPKTQSVDGESVELNLGRIAQIASESLGEVVGREVVENAMRDLVDRIGEICAEPDTFGIVTIDFGFAKLFSENKSVEFSFGSDGKPPPSRPFPKP